MQQYITFRRKKRQGPAPSLTAGKQYLVLEERETRDGTEVLITNDRGVNKWYYRDAFEDPQPSDQVPDLSAATPEQKEELIKGLIQVTANEVLKLFMATGLKTHIETMIVNQPTDESFLLSFRKIGQANPSNEQIAACLKAVGTGLEWPTAQDSQESGKTEQLTSEPVSTIDFDELWDEYSEYFDDQIDDLSLWVGSAVIGKAQWRQIVTEFQAEIDRRNKIIEEDLKLQMRLNMPGVWPQDQERAWQDYKQKNKL